MRITPSKLVVVRYKTVKGVQMKGKRFRILSRSGRHIELYVKSTQERVVFVGEELK